MPGEQGPETSIESSDNLPATFAPMGLSARGIFAGVAEAPIGERKGLYSLARDTVYLRFANDVLALSYNDELSTEERVASLELIGSALQAFLPNPVANSTVYSPNGSGGIEHALNTTELAVRFEQVRHRGHSLASRGEHLRQAFPDRTTFGHIDEGVWQISEAELLYAKDTCIGFIDHPRLAVKSAAIESRNQNRPKSEPRIYEASASILAPALREASEEDLLRAATIFTEISIMQMSRGKTSSITEARQDALTIAALRTPGKPRQLTDPALLAELNKLEVALLATAIVKVKTEHSEPIDLVEYGEFVFDPINLGENGLPNGLTAEETQKVREAHLKRLKFMSVHARNQESHPKYAELLARYQATQE
jgi:hypothetical protein